MEIPASSTTGTLRYAMCAPNAAAESNSTKSANQGSSAGPGDWCSIGIAQVFRLRGANAILTPQIHPGSNTDIEMCGGEPDPRRFAQVSTPPTFLGAVDS